MKALSRLVVAVAGVAAVGAVLWQGAAPAQTLDEEGRRGERIDAQLRTEAGRCAAREAVLDDLVGGRLTLAEAANRFGEINDVTPGATAAVGDYFACDTDEERLFRQVLHCAKHRLTDPSQDGGEALARLEGEMQGRFGHTGTQG